MLEGALLTGGAEDVTEPVNDEFEPQEERQRGQDQRRRPQIAPQATVEQAGGDEAPGQAGIVQPLHPGQPRAIVARRGVDGGVGVRAGGAGADQDGALAGAGHAVQVDAGLERDAQRGQHVGEVVGLGRRVDHDDHPGVGAGGEGGEARR